MKLRRLHLLSTLLLISGSILLGFKIDVKKNTAKIIALNNTGYLKKGKKDFKHTAVGYTDTKQNSAVPTVTITDPHIKSVWLIQGCGTINHTWLTGPGGNYRLPQGDATINPGTYSLQIDGKVVQTSGTTCGYGKVQITLYYN